MTDEAGNTYLVTPEDESDGNSMTHPAIDQHVDLPDRLYASSLTLTVNMGAGQRAEPVRSAPRSSRSSSAVVKQSLSRHAACRGHLSSCVSSTQPASPTDPAPDRPRRLREVHR